MGLEVITAATEDGLSEQEAKRHLRVESDDEDTVIKSIVAAATQRAQVDCNRQFVTTTYKYTRDTWPVDDVIYLPRPPLASVTNVKYIDADGDEQTLSDTAYDVFTNIEPGLLRLAWNQSWPVIRNVRDAIRVTFVAGYGAGDAVPAGIKQAIKLLAGHWFEHREAVDIAQVSRVTEVPQAYKALIGAFEVPKV